ncbi:aminopeptidase [Tannockella kyphosi]|uniref:aminopeptidase n=1 Tax=Tannockella kyphosi TaxID=2899121 RepID=UPI0020121BE5|nr:aminopeptidase [Tannockella kyphosi]
MYKKNAWEKYDEKNLEKVMEFSQGYKHYITVGKTERACVKESVRIAVELGYKDLSVMIKNNEALQTGDKVFITNMDKNFASFVIGRKPLEAGLRILGAHIDSPRLDLKQNPIYESDGFAMADTHYYGGVKKYQWVTLPLSIYGVVCKKDGTSIDVVIGEDDNDPVVGISDLLIHLSQDQLQKKAANVIEGEDLDITLGSMPLKGKEKDSVKANILKLLKDKYDIEEEDFISAEIEIVPSGKARDYGLDRSMVMGYGHDDRVCAYASMYAAFDLGVADYTTCAILVDKEEIGSVGATGAQSLWFENVVGEMMNLMGETNFLKVRRAMANSKMLSSDVSAGYDPLYANVNDKKNAAFLGQGVCFNKYTGARGKSGCNDANPEFVATLRKIMDDHDIHYQTAELGKVDQGGGGTIAYILGNYGMNVIDAGVAVLNMHAPWEIISKVDLYEAYLAYKLFLEKA